VRRALRARLSPETKHDVVVAVETAVPRRSRHVVDDSLSRAAADDVDPVDRRRHFTLEDRRPAHVPDAERQRRHVHVQHRVAAVLPVRHLQQATKVV